MNVTPPSPENRQFATDLCESIDLSTQVKVWKNRARDFEERYDEAMAVLEIMFERMPRSMTGIIFSAAKRRADATGGQTHDFNQSGHLPECPRPRRY